MINMPEDVRLMVRAFITIILFLVAVFAFLHFIFGVDFVIVWSFKDWKS